MMLCYALFAATQSYQLLSMMMLPNPNGKENMVTGKTLEVFSNLEFSKEYRNNYGMYFTWHLYLYYVVLGVFVCGGFISAALMSKQKSADRMKKSVKPICDELSSVTGPVETLPADLRDLLRQQGELQLKILHALKGMRQSNQMPP